MARHSLDQRDCVRVHRKSVSQAGMMDRFVWYQSKIKQQVLTSQAAWRQSCGISMLRMRLTFIQAKVSVITRYIWLGCRIGLTAFGLWQPRAYIRQGIEMISQTKFKCVIWLLLTVVHILQLPHWLRLHCSEKPIPQLKKDAWAQHGSQMTTVLETSKSAQQSVAQSSARNQNIRSLGRRQNSVHSLWWQSPSKFKTHWLCDCHIQAQC